MAKRSLWSRWWPLALALAVVAYALLQVVGGSLDLRLRLGRDEVWEGIQSRGVLRVGMEASYPPFEFADENGAVQGFDADLAHALAERWNVEVQFVDLHFDGLVEALLAEKFDLIISALPYEERLTRDVGYSRPYLHLGLQAISRAEDGAIAGREELNERRVAVELGSEAHQYLRLQNRDHGLAVEILAERTLEQAIDALKQGQADAVLCDRVEAAPFIQDEGLVGSQALLTAEPVVIAAARDASTLLSELNAALREMENDGTLARLERRWF